MVASIRLRYGYTVDAGDVIASVTAKWLAFARENGAPELTEAFVLGRPLWGFIAGEETIQLYRALMGRVRVGHVRAVVPFRCDSPTLRRYMRLEITPGDAGDVHFDGIMIRAEPRIYLSIFDPGVRRSPSVLTLCSFCKRGLVESVGWLEIEDVVASLHLLAEEEAPQLRHTLCPECAAIATGNSNP